MSVELLDLVRERIARQGPMTFAEYMEWALYHPEYGYYSSSVERIGHGGDFLTSPATHPAFGVLIGCQVGEIWDMMGRPSEFTIVEMGAADGRLCRDILGWLRVSCPGLYRRVRYVLVERSEKQRAKQRVTLARFRGKRGSIEFVSSLDGLPQEGIEGCFLSNELVDAFPVHRVMMFEGRLREVYVAEQDGRLVESLGEPSTAALGEHLRWLGVELPEGQYGEVNLLAPAWMWGVASRLRRGLVLTIDYGYTSSELYAASRREGTVLSYRRHGYSKDIYGHVGQQDLTAHVDFTALIRSGESVGLTCTGMTTQQVFLMRLGLSQYAEWLRSQRLPAAEFMSNVRAMDDLIRPEKLGGLKVLVQHKGVDAPLLTGLGATVRGGLWNQPRTKVVPRLRWRRHRSFLTPMFRLSYACEPHVAPGAKRIADDDHRA